MDSQEETKYCKNCKRDIAAVNYVMHEVHCARNIVLCKKCKEPVPRSEMEEHEDEYHKLVPCELCKKQVEVGDMDEHKENCTKRLVQCAYCEVDCPRDGLDEHMDFCGARTEQCPSCSQFIKKKDQAKHDETKCDYPPRPEPEVTENSRDFDIPIFPDFDDDPNSHPENLSFRSREMKRMMEPNAAFGRPQPREFGAYGREPPRIRPVVSHTGMHANPVRNPSRPNWRPSNPLDPFRPNALPTTKPKTRPVARPGPSTSRGGTANGTTRNTASVSKTVKPRAPLHSRTQNQLKKNTNETRTQNTHKSNLNPGMERRKAEASKRNPSTDQETLDRLYAMQISNNLTSGNSDKNSSGNHSDGDFPINESMISNLNSDVYRDADKSGPFGEAFDDGAEMLPCEFCHESFPFDDLILHQTGCNQAPANLFTERDRSYARRDTGRDWDISRDDDIVDHNTFPPQRVNEFSPNDFRASVFSREQENYALEHFGQGESVELPCEFCNELFPAEMLVMHQPSCDMNRTKTPVPSARRGGASHRGHFRGTGGQNSATRVQDTLTDFMRNPMEPPLHLGGHGFFSPDGAGAPGAGRASVATGYEPSFGEPRSTTNHSERNRYNNPQR